MAAPFSTPWIAPRPNTQITPPSGPPSPVLPTPLGATVWPGRGENAWSSSFGNGIRVTPGLDERRGGFGYGRRPLNEMSYNQMPSLGLASPFLPSDPNAMWGPPMPPAALAERNISLDDELAVAQSKIRELSMENKRLRDREAASRRSLSMSPIDILSPPLSASSSMFFDSYGPGMAMPGYGGTLPSFGEEETALVSSLDAVSMDESDFSETLFVSILRGTYNFSEMPARDIRPIVWIIAHRQPKTNMENSALKGAVSNLANRFVLERNTVGASKLIEAIIHFALSLCFTSCGNYLCQQLLERGETEDKEAFIREIRDKIVEIASDKFGTHVLCKAVGIKELEESIADALLEHGIFESLKTGARRLWREYLERSRLAKNYGIFDRVNEEMKGRWTDLACINEHGSIAVQQVFEVFGTAELIAPCFHEIIEDISRVGNNQFGHFVVTKLLGYANLIKPTCEAIIGSYPPVAVTHHGVNFVKIALQETGRPGLSRYIDAICSLDEGRTPGIVTIATSSVGKGHLTVYVLNCLHPQEQARVRQVCRAYSTTLRNSQSGNDLLRTL